MSLNPSSINQAVTFTATVSQATATGNLSTANGTIATATGQPSKANGLEATATGAFSNAEEEALLWHA